MAERKRTFWDDLVELGWDALKKLDRALNPDKYRKPARVPVPVRGNQTPQDPYND